jgi:hypothetical protein
MSKISNQLEGDLLNAVFNKTTYTSPTTWIALFTTTPTDTGGTEVTGSNAYARQEVAPDTLSTSNPNWTTTGTTGTAKKIENADTITFPQATGDWGTVRGFGIYDASSGGNLLWHGLLDTSRVVDCGTTFKFESNQLQLTLD